MACNICGKKSFMVLTVTMELGILGDAPSEIGKVLIDCCGKDHAIKHAEAIVRVIEKQAVENQGDADSGWVAE